MNIQIVYDKNFIKAVSALPKSIQIKLAKLLELLQQNPFHPLLHTKHLSEKLAGFLSFRITREWRIIFYFKNTDMVHLIKVGHRRDIYRQ